MHINPLHRARQADDGLGLTDAGSSVAAATGTGPLQLNTAAATGGVTVAPSLVSGSNIVFTSTPTQSTSSTPTTSDTTPVAAASSGTSQLPLGTVIGACVGAFIGIVVLLLICYAWFKRSTDKMSSAARRNMESRVAQQRQQARQFQQLDDDVEKPSGGLSSNPHDLHESDDKNFSMFKKSPSVRSAYTRTDEGNNINLPQLEFTKYHPTLAQELALEAPEKPFAAAAAAAARQNSGVSWDGETLGDDSFLSMRSVRAESGAMSPTMVMAKMTPPATASPLHRWESAEVLHTEVDASVEIPAVHQSRNPFAEMAEEQEQRSRATNPFFNAQDMTRTSRAARSRSNSRTSRTSRAQSIVRPESRGTITQNMNPFLDLHEALPVSSVEVITPHIVAPTSGLPSSSSVPGGASLQAFPNERAMASLIAALDLSKEDAEERLRVVSMQGSVISAYSETETDDAEIATVREFPLPPGTTPYTP